MSENFDSDDIPEQDANEKKEQKRLRIEREKNELLKSLTVDDISTLKNRVAAILNNHPASRDSDIILCIKYWETFQSEIYNGKSIDPADLFRLERLHYIVRARAIIQNEYKLFVASEKIKKHRKANEVIIKSEILSSNTERPSIKVFADETGKNSNYIMVAAVWILSGMASLKLNMAIDKWKESNGFNKKEVHFSTLGRTDCDSLTSYLDTIKNHKEFLGFKVIKIEKSKTRRSTAELINRLHEYMIKNGISHEISTGRIKPPASIDVTIDHEDSLDDIAVADIKAAVQLHISSKFGNESIEFNRITTLNSKQSNLLQLADIVAGAVNRIINHTGEQNYKDDFAREICRELEILIDDKQSDEFDSSAFLPINT